MVDKNPAKLKEMEALFWQAAKYQVILADNSVVARLIIPMPSLSAGRTVFADSGIITGTPNGDAPSILSSSYTFTKSTPSSLLSNAIDSVWACSPS